MPRRATALLAAVLALAAGAAGAGAARSEPADASPARAAGVPTIAWHPCATDLECGTLTVPLDHAHPELGTIDLPATRRKAGDQTYRIGTLFVNPGGPGGKATTKTLSFADGLGPEVRARFDVVGLAARGTEGPDAATCTATAPEPEHRADEVFPWTDAEQQQRITHDRWLADACRTGGSRVLAHMTTADVARDLDIARQAVGDDRLSYYGLSYGTYIGATYAAMFPSHVRAIVADAVVDPVAWSTGLPPADGLARPLNERTASGRGTLDSLLAVVDACERAATRCPQSATLRQDWATVVEALKKGPLTGDGGYTLRYDTFIGLASLFLYSPGDIPTLTEQVHSLAAQVHTLAAGGAVRSFVEAAQAVRRSLADEPGSDAVPAPATADATTTADAPPGASAVRDAPASIDATALGVLCSDAAHPAASQAWLDADRRARAGDGPGGFGQMWAWRTSPCATWPVSTDAAFHGPFDVATPTPVLVIGTEHDPGTPYRGAVAYHRLAPGSRLVTVVGGFGHGALRGSACVQRLRADYLLGLALPAADTPCAPDRPVFG